MILIYKLDTIIDENPCTDFTNLFNPFLVISWNNSGLDILQAI